MTCLFSRMDGALVISGENKFRYEQTGQVCGVRQERPEVVTSGPGSEGFAGIYALGMWG